MGAGAVPVDAGCAGTSPGATSAAAGLESVVADPLAAPSGVQVVPVEVDPAPLPVAAGGGATQSNRSGPPAL